jgi:hypothetical protein
VSKGGISTWGPTETRLVIESRARIGRKKEEGEDEVEPSELA